MIEDALIIAWRIMLVSIIVFLLYTLFMAGNIGTFIYSTIFALGIIGALK